MYAANHLNHLTNDTNISEYDFEVYTMKLIINEDK